MAHSSSSYNPVNMHTRYCRLAAPPAALLSPAAILQPPATTVSFAGDACTCGDERYNNDTATPHMVNAVMPLVSIDDAKRIAFETSSCSDSNKSQSRNAVAKSEAQRSNLRQNCGVAAFRKSRSTRTTTATSGVTQAPLSEDSNLHNSNLFIRNLDTMVSQTDLERAFAVHGVILSSAVMRDIHTGESLGTAFVRMSSHEEAHRTMEAMNGALVGSRFITVQWAKRHEGAPVGEARKKIMKLFVRNVPVSCTKMDLEGLFGQYGGVRQVTLHKDTSPVKDEAMVRLIAFVIYTEEGAAERAAREVHNTKPFTSCNGIPIMVKLAEDLAKPHRDHNHQHHQQKLSQSTPTAVGARQQQQRSNSERNSSALMTSKSLGCKQFISTGKASINVSSHTSSTTPSIRAGYPSRADASTLDLCTAAEVSFPGHYHQLTPPQCNAPSIRADVGPVMAASLHQHHTIGCINETWAQAPASLSPPNPLQLQAVTVSAPVGDKPLISSPVCGGATGTFFAVNSQQASFMEFSTNSVPQTFFVNNSAPQLSKPALSQLQQQQQQQQHIHRLQLPRFRQLPITVPVSPSSHSLPFAAEVPVSQETCAMASIRNPRVVTLSGQRDSMVGSRHIRVFSDPGEESDLPITDGTPATPPASLCPGRNVATTPPRLQLTYRHNPYINCSFIRVS
ncbi:hypothetical protein JKF63_00534 [Porcisia hertigi]|uniref:RRM domain-containing protein n=1 Tax=Porcisia hertigi TaxID=2761500 RepID=A0A836KX88_9TRYP|nr:hypothetical protein JKF63_00534 [Porcisia hertigi]